MGFWYTDTVLVVAGTARVIYWSAIYNLQLVLGWCRNGIILALCRHLF